MIQAIRVKTLLLFILAAFVSLLTFEMINIWVGYPLTQWKYPSSHTCSWIKFVPQNWECFDNWDSAHRINEVKYGYSSMRLDVGEKSVNCTVSIPISLFSMPSPSGFAIPKLCFTGKEWLYEASWKQDGWPFQFTGKNIDRGLYLLNLRDVGDVVQQMSP
jgi:hypothetical protein